MPTLFDPADLVCATPRSGSTLLCELLRATGRAGRRLEHFEVCVTQACHVSPASTSPASTTPACSA